MWSPFAVSSAGDDNIAVTIVNYRLSLCLWPLQGSLVTGALRTNFIDIPELPSTFNLADMPGGIRDIGILHIGVAKTVVYW